MTITQQGVIMLIKSAITGQAEHLPEVFSLEDAFPLLKEHQLIPIAYEGAVLCGLSKKSPVMRQMLQIYYRCALISEAQMKMVDKICEAFEQNGIDYMPVKGCNLKRLYPKPELRQMGDADILIHIEQYDRIRTIVTGFGFTEKIQTDYELVWDAPQLHLELHSGLISPTNQDFYAYFGDGWHLARKSVDSRYNMLPEDEFAYLFAHYAKHYRSGGIGCRHVVDLWVYRRTHAEMDEKHILSVMEKLKLREFYENTRDLIRFWFDNGHGNAKIEFMATYIFNSGSWGRMKNHILANELQNVRRAGSMKGGKLKTVMGVVFPPVSKLDAKYPVLKRFPWLLPVVWPIRWADVLLLRRDALHKRTAALKMATAEQIETYQQSLNYVGLDFNTAE